MSNQQVAKAPVAKPRILFLPTLMKGHAGPVCRLAKQFTDRGDHDVHIWIGGSFKAMCPAGATIHEDFMMATADEGAAKLGEHFVGCQEAPDWHSSVAAMVTMLVNGFDQAIIRMMADAVEIVKKVQPQIVVADFAYDLEDLFAGFCERFGARYFVVMCPARPEAILRPGVMLPILFKHFRAFMAALPKLKDMQEKLKEVTGEKATAEGRGLRILPGDRSTLQDTPGTNEHCVGPFLSVPSQRKQNDAIRRVDKDLAAWIESSPDPIVYVSLGTVVSPDEALVQRMADALGLRDSASEPARWRVLWSLPKALHAQLPTTDAHPAVQTARWRVASALPQPEILRHEKVRCFLSHCGQNSTHEGLVAGVPFVCMPFFCDQYEWADAIVNHCQAGVLVDKHSSTPSDISQAVTAVLAENSAYKVHAEVVADRLLEARQRADNELNGAIGEQGFSGVVMAAALITGEIDTERLARCQRPLATAAASRMGCCWAS